MSSNEETIYDLAYQCHDLVQRYRPGCRCTIHEMVGIWKPEADDDDRDKWLEGLTVRVWELRPGQSDRLVLECGPTDYPADLLDWLERGLKEGYEEPEDADGWLSATPKVADALMELLTHPLTLAATRDRLLRELLLNLPRARAEALRTSLSTEILRRQHARLPGHPGYSATFGLLPDGEA
jgi:hypothetical protein